MTDPQITAPARAGLLRRDGACLREGVARRPWMAGGMGKDDARATPTNRPHHQPQRWVEKVSRSITNSDTPHLLFTDEHRPTSPDPVAKAVRSPAAQRKAQTKRTTTDQPAHSYRTLLAELSTQTRNTTRLHGHASTFEKLTQPTTLQAQALDLAEHAPVVVTR